MIKDKSLRLFFIISILTAITFPLINITFINPSFTKMLIRNTEEEAARTGRHLSELLLKDGTLLSGSSITDAFRHESESLQRNFNIMKIKVFAPSGETLFSSNLEEIGKMNEEPYFQKIVARGSAYSKSVKKDSRSLEGQTVHSDVVETYVPVMRSGKFLGAFELYYDVTERNRDLNSQIFIASIIPLALMFTFLAAIAAVFINSQKERRGRISDKRPFTYTSPVFPLGMITFSIFIAEMIVMLILSFMPEITNKPLEALLASTMLVMFISPAIHFFFVQPFINYVRDNKRIEKELQESRMALSKEHEELKEVFNQVEIAKLQWEKTLDCVSSIVLLCDKDGKLLRYNKSLSKLMGNSCRKYLGKEWSSLLRDMHMGTDTLCGKGITLVQNSTGRSFELNTYAFYHSDFNLYGNVITINENRKEKIFQEG